MGDSKLKEVIDAFRESNGSKRKTATLLNTCRATVRNRLIKAAKKGWIDWDEIKVQEPQKVKCKVHYKQNGGTIEIITPTVPEPEEIFERSGVNPDVWEIYDIKIQDWSTPMKVKISTVKNSKVLVNEKPSIITNYLVSVKIRPKKSAPFDKAMRDLLNDLPRPAIPYTPYKMMKKNIAGELIPVDAHIGKMAWGKETYQGDMDLKKSIKKYQEGVTKSLTHLEMYQPSKIFYVVGNDLMHFENIMSETFKAHHRLDTDGRLPKVIRSTVDVILDTIHLAEQIAPVEVICVPGNHDYHANLWLNELLTRLYVTNKNINVDPNPSPHKFRVFGKTLLVWMHDPVGAKKGRAINDIPHKFRNEWGSTKWVEVHYGHLHKKEETEIFKLSSPGKCVFRQCSGLGTIDYWHFENFFTDAIPASEAFLIDKNWGVEANFTSNIDWEV